MPVNTGQSIQPLAFHAGRAVPRPGDRPEIAVQMPGVYNSAYFEHSHLAQQMGACLAEGSDLVVLDDDCVYIRVSS